MKSSEKDNFLLIKKEEAEDLTGFISEVTQKEKDYSGENVVIDLSANKNLHTRDLLGFLEASDTHRNRNKSFVIVNDSLGIDDLPEELVVVPTLQEAEDLIQMDEIQRDLGF
ncbi:ribonuclease Z [Christiangramia fulva]|uniref:Ribonuclease Z n=1 Tax=Christiangramia fulva TaxID=2126553 RepID=A0A2R3Z747_9FLAO|nr:ribonuclease Z [Christiangramia fulva]AVR46126.1 ribonuclease Z [Christiangramia fulva]